jgi:hypothetical protein
MDLLIEEPCDLLLVCTSMGLDEAADLVDQARDRFQELCIVRLLPPDAHQTTKPNAHATITINYNPEQWLGEIERLLTPGTKAPFNA